MGKINWTRVILGGLLAGVVIFVLEVGFDLVFGAQWAAALQTMGRPNQEPISSAGSILAFVLTFGVGIAVVSLYAVARPRFGPGPKTATIVGLGYWVIGYLLPSIAWGMVVGFPTRLVMITLAWALPEIIVATLAGAWIYKES